MVGLRNVRSQYVRIRMFQTFQSSFEVVGLRNETTDLLKGVRIDAFQSSFEVVGLRNNIGKSKQERFQIVSILFRGGWVAQPLLFVTCMDTGFQGGVFKTSKK